MKWLKSLSLLVVLLIFGCDASPVAKDPNIVLISIDTLRADHVGTYGYFRDTTPAIDELAEESVVFEKVFAPMATTYPAHIALLTGTSRLKQEPWRMWAPAGMDLFRAR